MRAYADSDKGLARESNQDSFLLEAKDDLLLAVVCDGVGGGNHGEEASQITVNTLKEKFDDLDDFLDMVDMESWLYTNIRKANVLVYKKGSNNDEYQGMGTTLVGLLHSSFGNMVVNIGDSRAYTLDKEGNFSLLTKDHSYVQMLIDQGQISQEEAKHHEKKHMITNAIGIGEKVEPDFYELSGDVKSVLLCSDGLHDYVEEKEIVKIIKKNNLSLANKVKRLIDLANSKGGYDNITVILIDLEDEDE